MAQKETAIRPGRIGDDTLVRHLVKKVYVAVRAPLRPIYERRVDKLVAAAGRSFAPGRLVPPAVQAPFLVVTLCNRDYVDFTLNWHHFFSRLGIADYLVLTLDPLARQRVDAAGLTCYLWKPEEHVGPEYHGFGSAGFARLTWYKTLLVLLLLRNGTDVLLTDSDTVWCQNPFPLLADKGDLQFQVDNHDALAVTPSTIRNLNVNTGFYCVRSRRESVAFLRETLVLMQMLPRFSDQACVNTLLRRWWHRLRLHVDEEACYGRGRELSVRLLDPLAFPNGSVFFMNHDRYRAAGGEPKVIHANWIGSREGKIEMLRKFGYWALP